MAEIAHGDGHGSASSRKEQIQRLLALPARYIRRPPWLSTRYLPSSSWLASRRMPQLPARFAKYVPDTSRWPRPPRHILLYLTSLSSIASVFLLFFLSTIFYSLSTGKVMSPMLRKIVPGSTPACAKSTSFVCEACISCGLNGGLQFPPNVTGGMEPGWQFDYKRDGNNLALDQQQCNVAFPGLFEDIHTAARHREQAYAYKEDLDAIPISEGAVRTLIYDRHLYVVATNLPDNERRQKALAILQSIYRALTATPQATPIPNIEWVFTVEDAAPDTNYPYWALTRQADDHNIWLMPDFAFWSSTAEGLGPYDDVVADVTTLRDNCWDCKIPMAVWRGVTWDSQLLRRGLIDAAKGKPWSDVQVLDVGSTWRAGNQLDPEAQCDYMMSIHAEGRSYSGALKYHQACRQVVIIHKLQWVQHYHYLLVSSGPDQNYVEVERDWSDLDAKVNVLLQNPTGAQQIADNSVRTFRERYLTPAADACYWRALITAWDKVSFEPELWEMVEASKKSGGKPRMRTRGMRFEKFVYVMGPMAEFLEMQETDFEQNQRRGRPDGALTREHSAIFSAEAARF